MIGVGGFLGVGEHLVAVPFEKVKFSTEPVAYTGAANAPASGGAAGPTTTTGAATAPARIEAESLVAGPRHLQRHQGRAEGDAGVQVFDLSRESSKG